MEQGNGAALVRRGADEEDVMVMMFYARYLEEGKGVVRDLAKAACWNKRALDAGGLGARPGYDRCSRVKVGQNRAALLVTPTRVIAPKLSQAMKRWK
jgi:TPR repeat protein